MLDSFKYSPTDPRKFVTICRMMFSQIKLGIGLVQFRETHVDLLHFIKRTIFRKKFQQDQDSITTEILF